jgi:adenylate cyclase, class 2
MRLSDKMPKRKIRRTPKRAASRKIGSEDSPKANPKHSEETEVKLRIADRRVLLRQLARLRASYHGRVHEMNTLYDTPDEALRREGKMLRVRVERAADSVADRGRHRHRAKARGAQLDGEAALLTFKGPVRREESSEPHGGSARKVRGGRYKIREEREARVADAALLARILEALGLRPSFRYEKYRSTYRLPGLAGLTLDLDETPIGDFLELEGSRAAIDRSAVMLGYGPADYITKSYGRLFLDEVRGSGPTSAAKRGRIAGAAARDMLFSTRK